MGSGQFRVKEEIIKFVLAYQCIQVTWRMQVVLSSLKQSSFILEVIEIMIIQPKLR